MPDVIVLILGMLARRLAEIAHTVALFPCLALFAGTEEAWQQGWR
jgi:hypothetical protein